ncbi:hypothetical protein [Pseudopedobacter beijingensis]|uniref:Uncharacterized protein n=1 Tax=Pseudopedobacter beijingensis TaxID=1207056 RepID=A0ABW4IAQ3_9SPHI
MTKSNFYRFVFLSSFVFGALFLLGSCSKSDNNTSGSVKVTYKIIGSSDTNITTVVYYSGNSAVTATGDFGSSWEKEATVDSKLLTIATANALGGSDNSTLQGQILINGEVVKENTPSTGKYLSTTISLGN